MCVLIRRGMKHHYVAGVAGNANKALFFIACHLRQPCFKLTLSVGRENSGEIGSTVEQLLAATVFRVVGTDEGGRSMWIQLHAEAVAGSF